LCDLVWFHEHALAESPSWAGVRRSYALSYWVQLGKLYGPALTALEVTRAQKAEGLRRGKETRSAFRDVAAIDDYLDAVPATYCLYTELLKMQPELAKSCAQDALNSVVLSRDYKLAAELIPDAAASVEMKSKQMNLDVRLIKHQPYSRAPVRWAYVGIYVEEIQKILKIKVGVGEYAEAARLKSRAIERIESPSLRREVRSGFTKRPRVPRVG